MGLTRSITRKTFLTGSWSKYQLYGSMQEAYLTVIQKVEIRGVGKIYQENKTMRKQEM